VFEAVGLLGETAYLARLDLRVLDLGDLEPEHVQLASALTLPRRCGLEQLPGARCGPHFVADLDRKRDCLLTCERVEQPTLVGARRQPLVFVLSGDLDEKRA
jgi:hypothetical protein